jgi:hypothetical protein
MSVCLSDLCRELEVLIVYTRSRASSLHHLRVTGNLWLEIVAVQLPKQGDTNYDL